MTEAWRTYRLSLLAVSASSINLTGSMRAFHLSNIGSSWVVSQPVSGGAFTRRTGSTDEAAECEVQRTGKLTFYPGAISPRSVSG